MAIWCYVCKKKLNMMNNISFENKLLCLDCRDLFDEMMQSDDKNEIENIYSKLRSLNTHNHEVESFINKHLAACLKKFKSEEQIKKELEEEQEKKRKLFEEGQKRKQKLFEEEQERKAKEQEDVDTFLKENGHEGYYQYKVINLFDNNSGGINVDEISILLNSLGRNGWHLKCAYSNELGHNSTSGGFAGFTTGTNSTIDQNILILERFIKFK